MNTKNIYIAFLLLISAVGFSSCEDQLSEITTLDVNRAFSPTDLTAVVINKTNVRLSWKAVNNAQTYAIEVFTTADFSGTPVRTIDNLTFLQVPYTVTGLAGNTQYAIRVKAIGEGVDPSKYTTVSVKTDAEQIFQDITPGKLTSTSVTLNWPAGENVNTITLTPGGINRPLTAGEIAAGEVTFTGLTAKTTYTANLLLNTAVRGTKVFSTPAQIPTGSDVVVLAATDDLGALIQAATKSTRFVLLEGTKYNSDLTVLVPGGIDISIIGEIGATKPIVSLSLLTLPTTGGKLHFENVDVNGYANGLETTTKRQYLINQSAATNMDQVSFENCNIRNFLNTPMRVQGSAAIVIDKFIVNNCLIDNVGIADAGPGTGTYAFISSTVSTGKINNITLTNSTFSNIGYSLILHSAAPSVSVTVENNTFYNVIGDGRYLIDYNAQVISSTFSYKNNILGKTLSPLNTSRGIRAGTVPATSNNFQTSDAVIAGNAIPGVNAYAGTSAALFTAPATKNFKIKDDGFVGKSSSGDPRWR